MNDLFSGSLGRINNHGGSRIFTTPHTIAVAPEYTVDTDVPSVAEFVACSLDGRLWVWQHSRKFYVAALIWDEDNEKLIFVGTITFDDLNIIGRGVDWILSDSIIIQASDYEPYVVTADIFSDNKEVFLYSKLRSCLMAQKPSGFNVNIGPGIDQFTRNAWGLSDDNGNSEGYGFFNRSAFLHSVAKHYSLLPPVGDWNIIGNFLVRRPDNPLSDAHNSMFNIRPLIPLEFVYYSDEVGAYPVYGTGFQHDIAIMYYNFRFWGRGFMNIGLCYIIPAVFDENGTPQEFYLYIGPNYKCSPYNLLANPYPDNNLDWLNLDLVQIGRVLYGFYSEQSPSLDNGLCLSSDNAKLFMPSSNSWQTALESGKLFVDKLNNSAMALSDNKAVFFGKDNYHYECRGIHQWLAPSGCVESVLTDAVIASGEGYVIDTHFTQAFYREFLHTGSLPISAKAFSGKQLSIGIANLRDYKSLRVSSMPKVGSLDPVLWSRIFRSAVDIRMINSSFDSETIYSVEPVQDYDKNYFYPLFVKNFSSTITGAKQFYPDVTDTVTTNNLVKNRGIVSGISPDWVILSYQVSVTFFYFHPDSGEYIEFSSSVSFPQTYHEAVNGYGDIELLQDSMTIPTSLCVRNGRIIITSEKDDIKWWLINGHYEETYHEWGAWHPDDIHGGDIIRTYGYEILEYLPEALADWKSPNEYEFEGVYNWSLYLDKLFVGNTELLNTLRWNKDSIPVQTLIQAHEGIQDCLVAQFREHYTSTIFLCYLPSVLTIDELGQFSGTLSNLQSLRRCFSYTFFNQSASSLFSLSNGEKMPTQTLHVVIFADSDYSPKSLCFVVIRSNVFPKVFDFYSEAQRSKIS